MMARVVGIEKEEQHRVSCLMLTTMIDSSQPFHFQAPFPDSGIGDKGAEKEMAAILPPAHPQNHRKL